MSGKNLLISDYLLFGGNFCDLPAACVEHFPLWQISVIKGQKQIAGRQLQGYRSQAG